MFLGADRCPDDSVGWSPIGHTAFASLFGIVNGAALYGLAWSVSVARAGRGPSPRSTGADRSFPSCCCPGGGGGPSCRSNPREISRSWCAVAIISSTWPCSTRSEAITGAQRQAADALHIIERRGWAPEPQALTTSLALSQVAIIVHRLVGHGRRR